MRSYAVILLFPTSFIAGVSYYPPTKMYQFAELNIYLFVVQLQFRKYE